MSSMHNIAVFFAIDLVNLTYFANFGLNCTALVQIFALSCFLFRNRAKKYQRQIITTLFKDSGCILQMALIVRSVAPAALLSFSSFLLVLSGRSREENFMSFHRSAPRSCPRDLEKPGDENPNFSRDFEFSMMLCFS